MNWNQIEGKWQQVRGKLRNQWGRLTNDDLDRMSGKRDEIIGVIAERYGLAKDQAEKQIDDWMESFDAKGQKKKPRRHH